MQKFKAVIEILRKRDVINALEGSLTKTAGLTHGIT